LHGALTMPNISNILNTCPLHYEIEESWLIEIREILKAEIPVLLVNGGIIKHVVT
jgi:hypothetical protein